MMTKVADVAGMDVMAVPDDQMPARHDWLVITPPGEPRFAIVRASAYAADAGSMNAMLAFAHDTVPPSR